MQSRLSGHKARQPVSAVRNIRLRIAFDGGSFHGWQIQTDKPTVQGTVQDAIEKITGERIKLIGSGRTDSGTHARGLVANFITASTMPVTAWVPALNRQLPVDVRVLSAQRAPLTFHARLAARSKIYRYQIYRGRIQPPHLVREYFHYPFALDLPIMEHTASSFLGEHDFASFAAGSGKRDRSAPANVTSSAPEPKTIGTASSGPATVRQIFRCDFKIRGLLITFTVEGDGFLHHMVRNMVGTLLELGRGRITLKQFQELFEKRDRTLAGFTAPAHGLVLVRVRY
jgi:tRNA pseudouridine38-40 synthase